ncbi:MAG: hypothetical protein Q4P36_05055 [Bowdeniella nasicola]|nr:hypothetical protein [Bowdeniella nasicola]
MGKKSFILGGIVGFVLGSRAGRDQYDKLKAMSQDLWQADVVQSGVSKVEETVGGAARNQAANLTDKVAGMVKDKIHSSGSSRTSGRTDFVSEGDGGPMEAAEPRS